MEEEEDGEELIGEDMMADYRPMGALDEYEEEGLDNADYGDMDLYTRAAAEEALEQRDGRERQSRMPAALMTSDDEGDVPHRSRRQRRADPAPGDAIDPTAELNELLDDDEESGINLEDYSGSLSDWIQSNAVSEEIKRRFRRFLHTFDAGERTEGDGGGSSSKYAQRVRTMCATNSESLEVSYLHLSQAVPILAIWVADQPKEMLELLDAAAMVAVRIMFPNYDQIHDQCAPCIQT